MDTVKSAAFDWISTDIVCHVVPLQQLSFLCPSACEDNNNDRLTAFDPGQPG